MPRMFHSVYLLALVIPVTLSAQDDKSSDWPQWRGPRRDNVSAETGLLRAWPKEGPKLLWNSRTANGGKSVGTGYSSLSVSGGKIFTMGDRGNDGFVFCLDEETGKHLWQTRISAGQGDGSRCTPTVDGNRVYALSRQGNLACLDTANGEIVWQKDFKKDFKGHMMSGWDYSESPLIDGDRLICTPGGDEAALVALDKKTGEVIWKAPIAKTGGAGYASIVIAEAGGIRQYITLLGRSRGLVGVDARNGKFLWSYNRMANGTANIPTAIVKGDLVFTSTGYDAGSALLQLVPKDDGIEAKEVYFLDGNTLQNHHGGMVLLGDYIFGGHGHNDGRPFCVDMKTGKFAWEPADSPAAGSAAIVYADGHLYCRYDNNVMALIEATPAEYRLKSKFNLPIKGEHGWQHPVVVHGKLYIRSRDQILCYDVKQR